MASAFAWSATWTARRPQETGSASGVTGPQSVRIVWLDQLKGEKHVFRIETRPNWSAPRNVGISRNIDALGGTTQRAVAHSGHSGGLGYSFRSWFHSQPHVCFCECKPCKHAAFTGTPSEHTVLPSTQQAKDCIIALRRHVALLTVPA